LADKTSLTNDELRQAVNFVNDNNIPDVLNLRIENMTDKQAKIISKCDDVYFHNLSSLTDKQAQYLSKIRILSLN
jgi:hypothetical protein